TPVTPGHPDTDGRNTPSRIQAENFDIAPAENGCVVNGTRYGEGSATDSSSLCEYCYCVRGQQRCVKPQCEMPLPGCTPRYRSLACCPVSYDCNTKQELSTTPDPSLLTVSTTSTTTRTPPRVTGCVVGGARHADGAQVRSLAGDCERCYCLRNSIRCITLECAPPLMGRIITEPVHREQQDNDVSVLLQLAEGDRAVGYGSLVADLRRHREMAENASSTDSTETPTVTTEHQETATMPLDQVSTTQLPDNVNKTEEANLQDDSVETRTDLPETTDSPNTQVTNEMEVTTTPADTTVYTETTQATTTTKAPTTKRPTSTKSPVKVTTKAPTSSKAPVSSKAPSTVKATTKMSTTKSPPSTKAPASTTKLTTTKAPTTTPSTTTTEFTTTLETSTTMELIDRVDNLDTLQEETTMETSTSSKPTTTTTISPILEMLEALMFNKNKQETSEDEYGQALPPSLPNITMIPFLPEDAVVDKKKDGYSSTESYYKGAPSVQRFSPPELVSGFVPRQPPQLDESAQFYQTSPQPDSSDILTAPQASPLSSLISITTPSPEGSMDSITVGSTITLANPVLASTGGRRACISPDGREVGHGERMASPGPCEECRCDHGTVLCHEEPTCIALTTGADKEADKRIDHDIATLSPSLSAVPVLPAPENIIGEGESNLSLDSFFDFLFQGEKPKKPQSTPAPTKPPPAIPARTPSPHRHHSSPSPSLPPSLASMLKVSGCNIYGRMYRVGRIISELSGPCRECMCTEMGVQCQSLGC
ncbi:hypothetical protein B566_EDAN012010, partial [Ephemera danica]